MAKSDGAVYIETLMDTKGFSKGMNSIENRMGNLKGAIGKLGGVIAATFAVQKLVQFGKEAINLGSDLQEVKNVVDVTFTSMSEQVNEFAKNAAESAGLSETMAKRYAGTFGAMAKAFGFAESESFNMSTALTQLAGDVASFYNISQDEAYTKLKSVFTGETETLKDLGIVMTQSALDSYALAKGMGKTTKQMSEQEKVALRYSFVLDQLSSAQGDFARTSDSWANQTRILSLNFDTFKANIGQALINIFTPFLKIINQIVEKMEQLSSYFVAFSEMLVGKTTSGGGGSSGTVFGEIASGYDDITDATNQAAKAQKNYTNGLDELNIMSSDSGGSVSGGGATLPLIPEETKENNKILENSNTIFDNILSKLGDIKNRLIEISDLFFNGFSDGLGNFDGRIQTIKDIFGILKESISGIFDVGLMDSFNEMIDQFFYSFGQITGAFSSIGLTIGNNLIGGFSEFLETDKGRIKQYLLNMFDIGSELSSIYGEYAKSIAYIFESFANQEGKKITSNILSIFFEILSGISELSGNIILDVTKMVLTPFINAKQEIKNSLEDILKGLASVTTFFEHMISDIKDFLLKIYHEAISPIFDYITQKLTELMINDFTPFFSQVGEFLYEAGEALLLLWDSILVPLFDWFIKNAIPFAVSKIETLINAIKLILSVATNISKGLIQSFTGIIQFIAGVFTQDWEKAWTGIKNIFSGIINNMISVLEFLINSSINLLNGLIKGVNDITGIVGVPSIPLIKEVTIPKLATGAVIPPNAPFVAMLGDQKHGNNIEAPEELIRKIVREESGLNSEVIALLAEIVRNTRETADKEFVTNIDGRELVNAYDERKERNGYAF